MSSERSHRAVAVRGFWVLLLGLVMFGAQVPPVAASADEEIIDELVEVGEDAVEMLPPALAHMVRRLASEENWAGLCPWLDLAGDVLSDDPMDPTAWNLTAAILGQMAQAQAWSQLGDCIFDVEDALFAQGLGTPEFVVVAMEEYVAATTTTAVASTVVVSGTAAIEISGFAFDPAELTVAPGTEVVWINRDSARHTVTAVDFSFDSPVLGEGDSFSFVFDTAGTFDYYCNFHPNMTGSIIVTG